MYNTTAPHCLKTPVQMVNRDTFAEQECMPRTRPPFAPRGSYVAGFQGRSGALPGVPACMPLEMGVQLILLLPQVRGECLVDILEHAVHRWLGLGFRCFERLVWREVDPDDNVDEAITVSCRCGYGVVRGC